MNSGLTLREVDEGTVSPCLLPDWFNPSEMRYLFRLLDSDENVMYYGLSGEPSFNAQDDYFVYAGCTETQIYNSLDDRWQTL